MLATASAKKYRDGKEAVAQVKLAVQFDKYPGPEALEVAAAAHAEAGDFAEAIRLQQQAIQAYPDAFQDEARSRLLFYQAKKAHRQD